MLLIRNLEDIFEASQIKANFGKQIKHNAN